MNATPITETSIHLVLSPRPLLVHKTLAHGVPPYRAIAIAPSPHVDRPLPPHVVPPSGGSQSAPSAKSADAESRPCIELIYEDGQYVALLIPRELTQAQLLIAELLRKESWRPRIDMALHWNQWRAYASPLWLPTVESLKIEKPTGPKLFFA